MYGIPNFKLEKRIVERRVKLLEAEGITFTTNTNVGFNIPVEQLRQEFDAIVLCGGSTLGRDLNVPGRDLRGIHLAMDYLPQQNKHNLGDEVPNQITAKGKHVIILGGGDTGADCLGTAHRQGAKSVHQFELLPRPPEGRTPDMPWPYWPMIYRVSSAHEEGGERDFALNTRSFSGDEQGNVKKLHAVRLEWEMNGSRPMKMKEIPGSEFEIDCDLCLLAMGFLHPEHPGPIEQLGLKTDPRGNVVADANYMTNVPGVFAAGDLRRGQSLVVWAISEGRQAARGADAFLMGHSDLPALKLF
jgi:glutamate synthase (NADPH/NADH) small chain